MKLIDKGVYLYAGRDLVVSHENVAGELKEKFGVKNADIEEAKTGTIAYKILKAHNTVKDDNNLKIKFDAITSHDITYVGIIQTAKASGFETFPIPYVLTNCHNSLCAVGGTINEDDHIFGLTAAKKFGGIFVPPHLAVIHQYMREMEAKCGKMILGSDSHTRYGALGTMAIGEGGPELVKQILSKTYDVKMPEVCLVYVKGKVKKGVGPQDVALAIIGAVFANGFVKNRVMEFVGEGLQNLSMDFRNGIDVMTTETTCLSSIWETDEVVRDYYKIHEREKDYKKLFPKRLAYYDRCIVVDLSKIEPMIALPFHPSNVYKIKDLQANPYDILKPIEEKGNALLKNKTFKLTDKIVNGKLMATQGIIAGCAGGMYENIARASNILNGQSVGNGEYSLSIYPSSQPVYKALVDGGYIGRLLNSGAIVKTAFCGPCFGAGDVPSNNGLSIRHTTRNFESREGSKSGENQLSAVALMDALSIAATSVNGGVITPATEIDYVKKVKDYYFNKAIYDNRVLNAYKKGNGNQELRIGPNITDWPKIPELKDNVLIEVVSVLKDAVTTTDELIPSGETSSYRSNPLRLAEFALSRKDSGYVGRAKKVKSLSEKFKSGEIDEKFENVINALGVDKENVSIGSSIVGIKIGDGSAREQAASCQRVLGGNANISNEYATKRYRSNLINWGMLPLINKGEQFSLGDYVYIEDVINAIKENKDEILCKIYSNGSVREAKLYIDALTEDEKKIIFSGCLINYYNKY